MELNKQEVKEKDIILAEDDRDEVLVFELALKEVPIPVDMRHAEDGEVLFKLLKNRIPDMLFLDVHMPCKNGISCIMEIRKNREYDNLPVIMYSADTSEQTIEQTFRNGANMYLTKTNTIRELVKKLLAIFSLDWAYMHYPPRDQFVLG